jgi:imidazolonepropionase-like amidohydrolase
LPLLLSLLLLATNHSQANENVPAPPQQNPILVTGATLHTVTDATIEGGYLLFEKGRIVSVSTQMPAVGNEVMVVDLAGKHIYPGLIAANTVLGLVEIATVRGSLDVAEVGPINPNARAEGAVNPDSELLPVTRANGILTALVIPQAGTGGLFGGRSALIELDGWTWEEMTVEAPVGVHIFWPRSQPSPFAPATDPEKRKQALAESLKLLNQTMDQAAAYVQARNEDPSLATDLRLEALAPLVTGELRAFIHADDLTQIDGALNFAQRHGLKMVLVGGYDAWRVTDRLRAMDVPVIVAGVHRLPRRRWEPENAPFTLPAKLAAAGVRFAIARSGSGFTTSHERNLPYEAAMAAAHGLAPDEALKALTLYPAEILGVADRLGGLAAGLDATFIITDGDPLEITTQVEGAFIRGRPLDLSSRHTRLYEKYQQRYQQLQNRPTGLLQ